MDKIKVIGILNSMNIAYRLTSIPYGFMYIDKRLIRLRKLYVDRHIFNHTIFNKLGYGVINASN